MGHCTYQGLPTCLTRARLLTAFSFLFSRCMQLCQALAIGLEFSLGGVWFLLEFLDG